MRRMKPCGLYRTTAALPGREREVGPDLLVYFHNHSRDGTAMLVLPQHNRSNRWQFHERGHQITDPSYVDSLATLKPEGFYRLRKHFHQGDGQVVAANALVQLGYNRRAEPLIFHPRIDEPTNALSFPDRGTLITREIYELLEPLDLRGPHRPPTVH
jgi:hypothetical protein